MTDAERPKCDFRLGEKPGSTPCTSAPVVECACRRCKEGDPFLACAEHQGAVRVAHSRVFPNHDVQWVVSHEPLPAGSGEAEEHGATTSFVRHTPFDLRCLGWSVAVHNDYRLHGEPHTFWLLTKGDRCVKGEGRTDLEALDSIRAQLRSQGAT